MEFSNYEKGMLLASASLADVEIKDSVCTICWEVSDDLKHTTIIEKLGDDEYSLDVNMCGEQLCDKAKYVGFDTILRLNRTFDTELFNLILDIDYGEDDEQEQDFLS